LLAHLKITEYLQQVAAGTAAPGGGSVAALNAALAAALVEMVASLTIGKKGYETVQQEMRGIGRQAAALREELTAAIDRDAEAYSEVMAAFKLPKETDRQKELRSREIQAAFKLAARVPLEVAKNAVRIIDLAGRAITSGNKNAVSDGAVAVMNARTAALAALVNVKINLTSLDDEEFVNTVTREVNALEGEVAGKEKENLARVKISLSS
jgi:formiminotetrahydrofolate cyclodeaminase